MSRLYNEAIFPYKKKEEKKKRKYTYLLKA